MVARIFLCHASEDKPQVRDVYHQLQALGFAPWLDEEDLLPGQEWEREIPRALRASDFILIFLSRTSVAKRGYVQREMKLALDAWQELPEGTIHTIPIRIDDCAVPEQFRRYHWANLFEPNGFDRIVRAIRAELAKRPEPAKPETAPSPNPQSPSQPSRSAAVELMATAREPGWTNSLGMEFVLIPAGTFTMGSPDADGAAEADERPAHLVTISQPFYLAKFPVTQEQWEVVMGNNPSHFRGNPQCPVESVSWDDVQAFLQKLNAREGRGDYRLPTEAEWEYACRAGMKSPQHPQDLNAIAWYGTNSNGQTQPVGRKLPNAWGLYDMVGNVWEWCLDGRREYTRAVAVDPMGPTDAGAARVIRGGGWSNSALLMRAAYRYVYPPGYRDVHLGFRCARLGLSR